MHPSYVISTRIVVPHVVCPSSVESLRGPVKICLDDLLYKDSAYDRGLKIPIRDFCSGAAKICIGFRQSPKTLVSKRGNYRLTRERYNDIIETLSPDHHADFDTGKMVVDGCEVVEPADVQDFVGRMREGHLLFGTEFVNRLVEDGQMLRFEGNRLGVESIFDCTCCGGLSEGYLRYLWEIREMNASTYLMIHNYNVLHSVMKSAEDGCAAGLECSSG